MSFSFFPIIFHLSEAYLHCILDSLCQAFIHCMMFLSDILRHLFPHPRHFIYFKFLSITFSNSSISFLTPSSAEWKWNECGNDLGLADGVSVFFIMWLEPESRLPRLQQQSGRIYIKRNNRAIAVTHQICSVLWGWGRSFVSYLMNIYLSLVFVGLLSKI